MGYILCTAVLILVVVVCVRSILRDHRQEKGCGGNSCSGNCAGCGGCGGGQDIVITVKRKKG
ncbi:MAG TPA: hypothetical protein DCG37_01990 [Lachnospiraceae bacterium]|nr:hypothetical protein [Lachnospiraceae bacterium]